MKNFIKKLSREEQSPLEKKVQNAVNYIAEVLNIPNIKNIKLPRIISDPRIEYSGYNLEDDTVNFHSEDPLGVYEEAGHIIHFTLNPDLVSVHINEKNSLADNLLDNFFTCILEEAFAYFCSRLSGEEREENHMEIWKKCEKPRFSRESYTTVGEFCKIVYRLYDIILSEEDYSKAKDRIEQSVKNIEVLCDNLDNINKRTKKLIENAITCSTTVASGKSFLSYKIIDVARYLELLFHSMGYDLGADLYKHYLKSPNETVPIANQILHSHYSKHGKLFFELYRKFHSDCK